MYIQTTKTLISYHSTLFEHKHHYQHIKFRSPIFTTCEHRWLGVCDALEFMTLCVLACLFMQNGLYQRMNHRRAYQYLKFGRYWQTLRSVRRMVLKCTESIKNGWFWVKNVDHFLYTQSSSVTFNILRYFAVSVSIFQIFIIK